MAEPRKTTGSYGYGDLEAWYAEVRAQAEQERQAALAWWKRDASWVQRLLRKLSPRAGT
jgi:hypothetical protein